jgi:hypothetical protein
MGNDEDAANDVNEASISWIRRHAHEDNRLLHVNYWDPHTDYGEPREWVQRTGEAAPRQDGPARARLSDWWHQYAGVPGAFPDPMQTTLDVRPTFQFEQVEYI